MNPFVQMTDAEYQDFRRHEEIITKVRDVTPKIANLTKRYVNGCDAFVHNLRVLPYGRYDISVMEKKLAELQDLKTEISKLAEEVENL